MFCHADRVTQQAFPVGLAQRQRDDILAGEMQPWRPPQNSRIWSVALVRLAPGDEPAGGWGPAWAQPAARPPVRPHGRGGRLHAGARAPAFPAPGRVPGTLSGPFLPHGDSQAREVSEREALPDQRGTLGAVPHASGVSRAPHRRRGRGSAHARTPGSARSPRQAHVSSPRSMERAASSRKWLQTLCLLGVSSESCVFPRQAYVSRGNDAAPRTRRCLRVMGPH